MDIYIYKMQYDAFENTSYFFIKLKLATIVRCKKFVLLKIKMIYNVWGCHICQSRKQIKEYLVQPPCPDKDLEGHSHEVPVQGHRGDGRADLPSSASDFPLQFLI